MFKSLFLPLILVAAFITLVGLLTQGKLNPILSKVSVVSTPVQKNIKINTTEIKVEVAKTDSERSKGLSNRTSLDEKAGMVFVFNKNSTPIFWMKDTKIPLDIIWIDENKIVEISKNVQPEPGKKDSELTKYYSGEFKLDSGYGKQDREVIVDKRVPVDYVLEVNGGFSDKYNIKVGQSLYGLEQL